jgi:hypothetical protein
MGIDHRGNQAFPACGLGREFIFLNKLNRVDRCARDLRLSVATLVRELSCSAEL